MSEPIRMGGSTILIVDDELQIRRFLRIGLEAQGHTVIEAGSGKDGVYQAAVKRPSCVILDLGLPDMDGQEVLRQIRSWSTMPVMILSVRNDEAEKISCFDTGADDYIVKPFAMGEFLARLRTILRRVVSLDEPVVAIGNVRVDIANRLITFKNAPVELTPTEYDLLLLFVKHLGKVLTHRQIIKEIWGPYATSESQSLRVYVRQLRKKLENDPAHPELFRTEQGVGYRMAWPESVQ